MKSNKPKVCNKRFKKIIEDRYYPISFTDRVNFMYHFNSYKKKEILNKSNLKITSFKS